MRGSCRRWTCRAAEPVPSAPAPETVRAAAGGVSESPPPAGLDAGEAAFARRFVAESDWTFAKTMPANPHGYVVRGRTADPAGFDRFAGLIGEHGWVGEWGGRAYRYLDLDGHSYWRDRRRDEPQADRAGAR